MQTSYPVTSRVRVCGCTQRRTNHSLPYTLSSRVLFSHPAFSHPAFSHPAPFPLTLSHSDSQLCAYAGTITFTIVTCSRASTIRSHRACGLVGHRRPHSLSLCVSLLPYTNCYLTITSIVCETRLLFLCSYHYDSIFLLNLFLSTQSLHTFRVVLDTQGHSKPRDLKAASRPLRV